MPISPKCRHTATVRLRVERRHSVCLRLYWYNAASGEYNRLLTYFTQTHALAVRNVTWWRYALHKVPSDLLMYRLNICICIFWIISKLNLIQKSYAYMHINAVYNLSFITCVIFCFMLQLPQGNDDVIVAKCRSTSGFIGSCIDSPCSPQLQVRARTARIDVKTANW